MSRSKSNVKKKKRLLTILKGKLGEQDQISKVDLEKKYETYE